MYEANAAHAWPRSSFRAQVWPPSVSGVIKKSPGTEQEHRAKSPLYCILFYSNIMQRTVLILTFKFVCFFLFKTHIKPSLISFLVLLFCRGLRLKTFLPLGADHSTKRSWIDGAFLSSLADWLLLAGHDLSLLLFFVGQTNQPPQVPQYYLSLLC